MKQNDILSRLTRRDFLKLGAGLVAGAAGASLLPKNVLSPSEVHAEGMPSTANSGAGAPNSFLAADTVMAATDGWIYLPPTPGAAPYHPDDLAPSPFNTYIFGFRNVTGLTEQQIFEQKGKAQHNAPLLTLNEDTTRVVQLYNLGLQMRPDLVDSHTVHWHGFKNAIPMYDGEPSSSGGVPIGRNLKYVYKPHDPGTYMYHCHFEDVEHVQMGMTGPAVIYPKQYVNAGRKGVYNDGDWSTEFDREFIIFLSEFWSVSHWSDSHIQLAEWSDYRPEYFMMNGRVYPHTLEAPGGGRDAKGDLIAPTGLDMLQYQPMSALVNVNAGDRVLLRFINLGYTVHSLTLDGLKMRIVGKDATMLKNGSTNLSYLTSSVTIGPGESAEGIFVAPPATSLTKYALYNRNFRYYGKSVVGGKTYDIGQRTEIRVNPTGTLPPQAGPNL
jgi:FtsP/CotA-like multicopper oxidase with cupredoxin domain